MRKPNKIILVLEITVALLAVLFGVFLFIGIKYQFSGARSGAGDGTALDTLVSDDGKYRLVICQIGDPDRSYGAARCRFVLYQEEREINKLDFTVRNNGGPVRREDFDTRWESDRVTVTVRGTGQEEVDYYLFFNGSSDIRH